MSLFGRPATDDGASTGGAGLALPFDLASMVRARMEIAHRAWSVATADVPIEREELAIIFGMLTAIGQDAGLDRPAILAAMQHVLDPEYGPCIIAGTDIAMRDFVADGGRCGVGGSPDRITARAMRYVVELTTDSGVRRWTLQ